MLGTQLAFFGLDLPHVNSWVLLTQIAMRLATATKLQVTTGLCGGSAL